MQSFVTSRWTKGNLLFPEKLDIDDERVIYHKTKIIGYRSTVISRQAISNVSVSSGIFFADVIIDTFGSGRIVANGFYKSQAKEILRLLTSGQKPQEQSRQ